MGDQAKEGLLSSFLQQQRINAVESYLYGKVLDVGCGSGKLAAIIPPERYYGMDISEESLRTARLEFPSHFFSKGLPEEKYTFDTVVMLALIEHIIDPVGLLKTVNEYLSEDTKASIVLTTPHPSMDWIHYIGARLGLFSKEANDEHQALLGKGRLEDVASAAGMQLIFYKKFLVGANQIAILQRR